MSASNRATPHASSSTRAAESETAPAESLTLDAAVAHLLDECRMVLPGIQALLGFQLIAVFDMDFAERLTRGEQRLHLAAIGLVALAVALVLTPVALHRQTNPRAVTERFLHVASRLLVASMLPLAFAIAAEVYIVARLILGTGVAAAAVSGATLVLFLLFWFVLPRTRVAG